MKSIEWTPRDFGWKAELERQFITTGLYVMMGLAALVIVILG